MAINSVNNFTIVFKILVFLTIHNVESTYYTTYYTDGMDMQSTYHNTHSTETADSVTPFKEYTVSPSEFLSDSTRRPTDTTFTSPTETLAYRTTQDESQTDTSVSLETLATDTQDIFDTFPTDPDDNKSSSTANSEPLSSTSASTTHTSKSAPTNTTPTTPKSSPKHSTPSFDNTTLTRSTLKSAITTSRQRTSSASQTNLMSSTSTAPKTTRTYHTTTRSKTTTTYRTPPTPPTFPPKPRFCNKTINNEYDTPCVPCNQLRGNPCRPGEQRAMDFAGSCRLLDDYGDFGWRRGRQRRRRMRRISSRWTYPWRTTGCSARCLGVINIPACCPGFWGENCDECPGGARNPCNGYGVCQRDGKCLCAPGFHGTACEICVDTTKYGPYCLHDCDCEHGDCVNLVKGGGVCSCHSGYKGEKCDQHIEGCVDLNCSYPGFCRSNGDQGPFCSCPKGYKLAGDGLTCIAVNPCLGKYPLCGKDNNECKQTGPNQYECVCSKNYTGDGIVCIPIDPCQTNRGGCPKDRYCRFKGPNWHECVCMLGYKPAEGSDECILEDVCTPSTCHSNATCETTRPLQATCTCVDGYVGNGTVCYGNIIERLKDLDSNYKPLKNNLEFSIHYLSKYYMEEMTQHGPFTIFVPTDKAFKGVRRSSGSFNKFLEDKDRALQIMRQHILIGQYRLEDLQIYDKFYTLQGNPALLQVKVSKNVFKYKLDGTRGKGKVKVRNMEASNGMIHVVNNLLTTEPEIEGDPKGTAFDLMQQKSRHYETTVKMIKIVGLEAMFSRNNVTVFGVVDDAWKSLPKGAIDYLSEDPDGQVKLKDILLNHVAPGAVGITHLINMETILTMDDYNVNINISKLGQVRLENKASITQANIVVQNGFVHRVDGLIVPSYIDVIYPNFCPTTQSREVQGRCMPCRLRKCPRSTDLMTKRYSGACVQNLAGMGYCKAICTRETKVRQCCSGFYGTSCLPCPSGFRAPCSGKGQCDEGIIGSGRCKCEEGFAGSACQTCLDTNMYGPSCNNTCTCLHGLCNNGPDGDGLCRKDTCQPLYISENCDRKLVSCGPRILSCHAHSYCYVGSDSIYRCKCNPGYEADGEDCVEMDPCEQKLNGGCHQQAQCIKLSPLDLKCECNEGWVGDGVFCSPKSPCYLGCHEKATCEEVNFEYHCVCDAGYKGNGTWCETDNVCVENNGGCHPMAICTPLRPGLASGERRTCVCPFNMSGNGTVCYGTIAEQVMAHPNLTRLAEIMASVPKEDLLLSQDDEEFTFFAPTDAAVDEFIQTIGGDLGDRTRDYTFVINFLNFHTLYRMYTMDDLDLYDGIVRSYETLYDGFSLFTVNTKEGVKIVVNHSKFASFVVSESNRLTTNGIYHVVDKVLESFLPENNVLSIESALKSNPEYSVFYNLLKDTNVLKELKEKDEFTVFVPTNDAFGLMNQHLSASALKYYVVPSLLFTPSVYQGQRVDTLLGPTHQLEINLQPDSVSVNGVQLSKPDVLIEGGVIHQINGLLYPVLNWCNASDITIDNGPCNDCTFNVSDLSCHPGFSPFVPARVLHLQCVYNDAESGSLFPGCNQICGKVPSKATCCAGYFGPHCQECPGGAEFPCNGRGTCFDSFSGNGTCDCESGFTGPDCSQCEVSSMALPHCNTTHPSCETEKSGCHENAVCTLMLQGPGHCTCTAGYHGDGQRCEVNVDPCQSKDKGGCDGPRASCDYTPPSVTDLQDNAAVCRCLPGYGGNGTLCTKSMLDLVSRLPELRYFKAKLDQMEVAIVTKLMENPKTNTTLFAPISENYVSLKLNDLIIQGDSFRLSDLSNSQGLERTKRESNAPLQKSLVKTVTALGGQEINITVDGEGQFFANDVPILEKSIATLNGLLLITESPISSFTPFSAKPSQITGKSDSTIIAVCVVTVLLVLIIVIVVVAVIYVRSKKNGGFRMFNRSKSSEDSDTSVSFARLNAVDEDGDSYRGSDPAKYDNPIFDDPEFEQ